MSVYSSPLDSDHLMTINALSVLWLFQHQVTTILQSLCIICT